MKRGCVLICFLLLVVPPARAGQGSITETDTAIIVEYIGDPTTVEATAEKASEEGTTRQKAKETAGSKVDTARQGNENHAGRRTAHRTDGSSNEE